MTTTPTNIPWFIPVLDEEDSRAVADVVRSTYVNEGPENHAFEETLKKFFSIDYAITTPNGTTALALALWACGIQPGDHVLVPDITFIGSASAVRMTGAEPVLVDIDPTTFTMDPADAYAKFTPNTTAIMPVHLTGRSADMPALKALAHEKKCILIEDAAEALGSKNEQGYLGAQSEAGCFSMAPTKIITSGQGGFILTAKRKVYENLVRLRDHGRLSRASDLHPVTGYNFKVTDLQAALARSQWQKLPARIQRSREIDQHYQTQLADIPDLAFPARQPHGNVLMWPDFTSPRRDELVAHLLKKGIHLRPFWPPIHTQPAYATEGLFPGANLAANTACWLPCSPDITDQQIHLITKEIRTFLT